MTTEQSATKLEAMDAWRASIRRARSAGTSCTDGLCGAMDCRTCRGDDAVGAEDDEPEDEHLGCHTQTRGCEQWVVAMVDGLRIVHFKFCPFCGETVRQPEESEG